MTIDDIAKELGVSKTTVSRAISGKGRISQETKQRVQDFIELHDYRPNAIAKSLAQSKTFNIGVILPAEANLEEIPFFQSCLLGICDAAVSFDYDVVVTNITEDSIYLLQRLIERHKVDGIILMRSTTNDLAVEYLKQVKIPFILIGSSADEEIMQVDTNHLEGCCELTSYLIKLGYSRIALLGGNQRHTVNINRYEGFLKAFELCQKTVDKELIYLNLVSKMMIQNVVDQLLAQGIDCIVCTDDFICSHVLMQLNERNLSIPKDIKVASFYDSQYLANYNPSITALRVNVKKIGIEAGEHLINLIDEKNIEKKTLLDYELVLRKSTTL